MENMQKIVICSRVVTAGLLSGDFRHCTSIFHHMWRNYGLSYKKEQPSHIDCAVLIQQTGLGSSSPGDYHGHICHVLSCIA